MPKTVRAVGQKQDRAKRLSQEERIQMVEEYERDPAAFCVKLFASHNGDHAWWRKNRGLIPEKILLEDYIFTAEGVLRAELKPYEDDALKLVQHRYPQTFHGLLVKYGATARLWEQDDLWSFHYRLPFHPPSRKASKEAHHIDPRAPCPVPSLLLELECFVDPEARIYFGESNASRLMGDEHHWAQFWGSYSFTESVSLKYNLFQYFLLMRAYAIQIIHLGLDTFREVRARVGGDFTAVLQSYYRHEKNWDSFSTALRQFDHPRAETFARELAWNYVRTMSVDNFDTDFAHLEANYGFVGAFLEDEVDLLRFLKETRSLSLRDALESLGSRVPTKVLRYLRDPVWARKKQGTDWRSIKKRMGLDGWEETRCVDTFDGDPSEEFADLDF